MISLRVAGAAALAGSLLAQAAPPALAQDDQERVPLIMSKLPPQGSGDFFRRRFAAARSDRGLEAFLAADPAFAPFKDSGDPIE